MSWFLIAFVLGAMTHAFFARFVFRADRRDTPLHIACRKGNAKAVRLLLDRGAKTNVPNFFRETPLLLACSSNDAAIVKMLLDKQADANDACVAFDEAFHDEPLPLSTIKAD